MTFRIGLAALATGLLFVAAVVSAEAPAIADKPVVETHFGTRVTDPYRYLENVADPEVADWMKAQSEHARVALDAIPGREDLLKRLLELQGKRAATVAGIIECPGELLFYMKRGIGQNVFKVYLRDGFGGRERLLVDPEVLQAKTGVPHAVNYFSPSWDGRYLAYGVSAGGSEDASLHIMDVASGEEIGEPVPHVPYGGVSWTPDSKTIVFNQRKELPDCR